MFSLDAVMLILYSVETGKLIGYLEWAEPVIQDSGAKYYQMRVCQVTVSVFVMTY